jgi:hypothetical protein
MGIDETAPAVDRTAETTRLVLAVRSPDPEAFATV